MPTEQNADILQAMKESAAALRDNDIDFALAGGLAAWARGGPATEHDVDLVIREADVERALVALRKAGMRTDIPPEGWLAKAWHEDTLIDLIHSPMEVDIDDAFFARCDVISVAAVMMPVMQLDDVLVSKLLALSEHHLDFAPPLEWARALREQITWADVEARTRRSPFARTFFHLLVELGVLETAAS